MTTSQEFGSRPEAQALALIEAMCLAEHRAQAAAYAEESSYIFGLGVAVTRQNGAPWVRYWVMPKRLGDSARKELESIVVKILRGNSDSFGLFGATTVSSQSIDEPDNSTRKTNVEYVSQRTGVTDSPTVVTFCLADRRSGSGLTPSVLRRIESRARFILRRTYAASDPLSLIAEACSVNLLTDACELLREYSRATSVILWRYDSSGHQFTSIAHAGVREPRREFRVPLAMESSSEQRGIVSMARPENPYVLYDRDDRSRWYPPAAQFWRPRDQETFKSNEWRSCVAFPITTAGFLSGAISFYAKESGSWLRERVAPFVPVSLAALQGVMRARDEASRLELMERRFDSEFEEAAVSLSVIGHAHDFASIARTISSAVNDVSASIGNSTDLYLRGRLDTAQAAVESAQRLAERIKEPGRSERRLQRSYSQVNEIARELEPYLKTQVATIGQRKVAFAMIVVEAQRGYSYRAQIDPLRVERVIVNLVENAAYWARRGRGAPGDGPRVQLRVAPAPLTGAAEGVLIQVFDNGPGVPDEVRPFIFDRFYTSRDEGGMGLGLYLTRKFVGEAHGKIRLSSKPGSTTFSVVVPVSEAQA